MAENIRYVPILKAKQGEMGALAHLDADATKLMTPLIDLQVVPWDYEKGEPKHSLQHHLDTCVRRIAESWPFKQAFFLDQFDLPFEERLDCGLIPAVYAAEELRAPHMKTILVTGLDRPPDHQAAVVAFHRRTRCGVCVRVVLEDLDVGSPLGAQMQEFLADHGVSAGDVDLILDSRQIRAEDLDSEVARVSRTVRDLPNLDGWRSLTVASGAMPENLAEVIEKESEGRVLRVDYELWRRVVNETGRSLSFGDYGVLSPVHLEADSRVMSRNMGPKIRYAVNGEWYVVRGGSFQKHARRFRQYYDLAGRVQAQSEFLGREYSWGDSYIDSRASEVGGTGNPCMWISVDTNHHLMHVIEQLARDS